MFFFALAILFSPAHASTCCADYWDDRAVRNCQRRSTPPGSDQRVMPRDSIRHMDTEVHAWAVVTRRYPGMPQDGSCCLTACCHRTTWPQGDSFYSRGIPHITIKCEDQKADGSNMPWLFVGRNHYNCDDGTTQYRRRVDDDSAKTTLVSNAPNWVELTPPSQLRRLLDAEASSESSEDGSGDAHATGAFVSVVMRELEQKRVEAGEATVPFAYVGCYSDDGDRDLPLYKGRDMDALACAKACSAHLYFSLQFNGQCFCGDAFATQESYTRKADAECGADLKGREWRNAIFIHDNFLAGLTVYDHTHFENATLSSTYGDLEASRCLDGDLTTVCHSGYDERAWLRFDLETAITVLKVSVANRADCCQDRLGRFQVMLKTAHGWTECRKGVRTDTSKQWQDVWCHKPTRATQVQIQFDDDHEKSYLHVADIKITGQQPVATFVGCFRDDDERDLSHYKGVVSSIEECQKACAEYSYFAMQDSTHCFCGDAYATEQKYINLDNSDCGADLKGRTLTNAVYATDGGAPMYGVDRRRFSFPGGSIRVPTFPNTWDIDVWRWGEDILSDIVDAGVCAAQRMKYWMKKHPWAAKAIEVLGGIAIIGTAIAALPEEIVGVTIYEGVVAVEEIIEVLEEGGKAVEGINTVLDAVPSVVDVETITEVLPSIPVPDIEISVPDVKEVDVLDPSTWGFGRRRLAEKPRRRLSYSSKDGVAAVKRMESLLKTIKSMVSHQTLKSGLQVLAKLPTQDMFKMEYQLFDTAISKMGMELDSDMMKDMDEYLETYAKLASHDVEDAVKALEETWSKEMMYASMWDGVHMDPMQSPYGPYMYGGRRRSDLSGEGTGAGSAEPSIPSESGRRMGKATRSKSAVSSTSKEDSQPASKPTSPPTLSKAEAARAEASASWPEVDTSAHERFYIETEDGRIVSVRARTQG